MRARRGSRTADIDKPSAKQTPQPIRPEPVGQGELVSSTVLRALLAKLEANPHPDPRVQIRAVRAVRTEIRKAEKQEAGPHIAITR